MMYPVSERFKAPQGEGVYTGVPMAFIRFVGCSVGKKTCTSCDTDFESIHSHLGGGKYDEPELDTWAGEFKHVCLTGGEPLDRDLVPLMSFLCRPRGRMIHVETSGTVWPRPDLFGIFRNRVWLTVSPKPGYLRDMIDAADEIKVIHCGLGDGDGWPSIADAIRWADEGKVVYLQPRNDKFLVNDVAMSEAVREVMHHPQLRLSAQLHKYVRTR